MKVGASTSNLYPMPTEQALQTLLELGFRRLELFLNTRSETEPGYVQMLYGMTQKYGAHICAVHPYLSALEPFLFFSEYERRFSDALETYRTFFQTAQTLGAQFVVLHGDRDQGSLPVEESVARFERLYDLGREYGVTLAQENVVRNRSKSPEYLETMARILGRKAHFVLDLKQCRRCGLSVQQVLAAMGDGVCHVHISDSLPGRDCLPPGKGDEDFAALIAALHARGFTGTLMLELYRHNFAVPGELLQSAVYVQKLLEQAGCG